VTIRQLSYNEIAEASWEADLLLAQSASPLHFQQTLEEVLKSLQEVKLVAFDLEPGVLLAFRASNAGSDHRLVVAGFYAPAAGFRLRKFAKELQKLAVAWNCAIIQTDCFTPRFAKALQTIGAEIESYTLTLAVSKHHG
jgi:hypothetical protein